MAQTTTYETILDQMVVAIGSIAPSKLSSEKFRAHRGEVDFADWVDQNPSACFRRFEIANPFSYEQTSVTDGITFEFSHNVVVMIAYPKSWAKYGLQNMRDADVLIDSDFAQIDRAIGLAGYATYPSGQALAELASMAPVKLATSWILQLTYRLQYDRSY